MIGTIEQLCVCLPRKSLLTIYESFVWQHLDYGDTIYDNPVNGSLTNTQKSLQESWT